MRIYQYPRGLGSLAYTPDGTLFVLTRSPKGADELWAHLHASPDRVQAARSAPGKSLSGWLDASPDGRWLAVQGMSNPILFRIGALTPNPDAGKEKCSLLSGWSEHTFPKFHFVHDRTCFTGDSTYWVGRTKARIASRHESLGCWHLSDMAHHVCTSAAVIPNKQCITAAPSARHIVIEGWSREHKACALWRVNPAAPETPPELIGTVKDCNGLSTGSDERYYVSYGSEVGIYSPVDSGRLKQDLVFDLKEFGSTPRIKLCADARLFVAYCFRTKFVYGGNTRTGAVLGPWDWKIGEINDVAISHDGLTAAAAGSNKKAAVWDLDQ